jgi:agmatine deiminase
MIPDWQVNTVFLPTLLLARYPSVSASLQDVLSSHAVEVRVLSDVRDIWARDYSPIQVASGRLVQFRYEPDYLAENPELRTGREVAEQFHEFGEVEHSDINLDGGNVVASEHTAILTDKIYRENPTWERAGLRAEIRRLLQVDQLIVIPKEPYDLIGHADAMVRFIDEKSVLVNNYSRLDRPFGERLLKALQRQGLKTELLPYFHEKHSRSEIPSAVGCFTNFLRTERLLILPAFGSKFDEVALGKLESGFPVLPIVPLDCTNLAREGGILNCVTAGYRDFTKAD